MCMVYKDVMLAWNSSANYSFNTFLLYEVKTADYVEHHHAQHLLMTALDMCLLGL